MLGNHHLHPSISLKKHPGKHRKVPFFKASGLLVLGVNLMETNSNLFSRLLFLRVKNGD